MKNHDHLSVMLETEITASIQGRRLIHFTYDDCSRDVEPHTLGRLQNGNVALSGFQVGGFSVSGHRPEWRLFSLDKITGFRILDLTFTGTRPGYNPRDSRMSRIFASL
jgi:hypothetical protein